MCLIFWIHDVFEKKHLITLRFITTVVIIAWILHNSFKA